MQALDIKTPIGILRLEASAKALYRISWKNRIHFTHSDNRILQKTKTQILEYFSGKRKFFNLPLDMQGTEFQKKVWKACGKIPFGKTTAYGELAQSAGHPKAARAVGSAMAKNPLPIIIPCHRVVTSSGKLGGYSGNGGLKTKRYLLSFEKAL